MKVKIVIYVFFSIYRLCPIFQVSNVSGENLDLLKMFLNLLTTRMASSDNEPAEFQIDDTYSVPVIFISWWCAFVNCWLILFFVYLFLLVAAGVLLQLLLYERYYWCQCFCYGVCEIRMRSSKFCWVLVFLLLVLFLSWSVMRNAEYNFN